MVAVISVVSFQSWFSFFSDSVFVDVEDRSSQSLASVAVEGVIGDELYIKKGGSGNVTIKSVLIGDVDCGINGSFGDDVLTFDVSGCIGSLNSSVEDVVVITESNVITRTEFFEKVSESSFTEEQLLVLDNLLLTATASSGPGYSAISGIVSDKFGNMDVSGYANVNFDFGSGYNFVHSGDYDFFLVKYNSSGDIQFLKTDVGGSTAADYAHGVEVDDERNIYVTGTSKGALNFGDGYAMTLRGSLDNIFLVKYNSVGVAQFVLTGDGSSNTGNDYAEAVEVDSSGNIYVAGVSDNDLNFGSGVSITNDEGNDFFLVKYDSLGVPQFVKSSEGSSGSEADYVKGMGIDKNDEVYVAGYTRSDLNFGGGSLSNSGGTQPFVYRYKSDLN